MTSPKGTAGAGKTCPSQAPSSADPANPASFRPVQIPTEHWFLRQWFQWTHSRVAKLFKRDKDRIPDTVQRVRFRLLQKEFTGRWFFKHLREELVDRPQAERILGGKPVAFCGALSPVAGSRMDPNSLWRVDDLLKFARFDYKRFYYSVQGHTVDSAKALSLLGYPPGQYTALQSLWRQGAVLPAELTEHDCVRLRRSGTRPKECKECVRGLSLLRDKGVTLASDWSNPSLAPVLKRMRWNDSQLRPYLRRWRGDNRIHATPTYIMRPVRAGGEPQGIDAGLLAYARKIIENEVINDFKHMSRTDDLARMVYNNGVSPETPDSEAVAYDSDCDDERAQKIPCDPSAAAAFGEFEHRNDLAILASGAGLSEEELEAVRAVDLMEMTVRQYADQAGIPAQRVHRLRSSAMRKLRAARVEPSAIEAVVRRVCEETGCTRDDVFGPGVFGPCVTARTELFFELHELGMSEDDMATYFRVSRDRVCAALGRAARLGL